MKKLCIVHSSLASGGVENAICNFANFLNANFKELDVTILLIKKEGLFLNKIPSNYKIKTIEIKEKDMDLLFKGGIVPSSIFYLKQLKLISFFRLWFRFIILGKVDYDLIDYKGLKDFDEEFDYVICSNAHMPFLVKYCVDHVKASKHFLWIHSEFKRNYYRIQNLKKYVNQYDGYLAVSETLKDEFISIFPENVNKTYLFHNILPITDIITKSNEQIDDFKSDKTKILTVGRLHGHKGYEYAIKACALLKGRLDFVWYAIGEGPDKEKLEKMIIEYDVEDCFKFLGIRKNPYPYMKNCDIYVQPSRNEGYSTTVAEAKCLNKKIVATLVSGTHELLDDYKNSRITKIDEKDIAEAILSLLEDDNDSDYLYDISSYNLPELNKTKELFEL